MIFYLSVLYRVKFTLILSYDLLAYCSLRFDPLTFTADIVHGPQELLWVFLLLQLEKPFLEVLFFFLLLPDGDEPLLIAGCGQLRPVGGSWGVGPDGLFGTIGLIGNSTAICSVGLSKMPGLLVGECPFLCLICLIDGLLAKDDIEVVFILVDHFFMILEQFHYWRVLKLLGVVGWHLVAVLPLFDFSLNFLEDVVLPLEKHCHLFIEIKLPLLLGHPLCEAGRLELNHSSVDWQ